MAKCDLCELKHYTPWYCEFETPFKFAILDCDSCDTPMAVLGDHRAVPTEEEKAFMVEALALVARHAGEDIRREFERDGCGFFVALDFMSVRFGGPLVGNGGGKNRDGAVRNFLQNSAMHFVRALHFDALDACGRFQ